MSRYSIICPAGFQSCPAKQACECRFLWRSPGSLPFDVLDNPVYDVDHPGTTGMRSASRLPVYIRLDSHSKPGGIF